MKKDAYHTQRKEKERIKFPLICERNDAWLGKGYYFWLEEFDAIQWGHNSKKETGYFEIYKAKIDSENILDTVFNEKQYYFWKNQIEKIATKCFQQTGKRPTKKYICNYLTNRADWVSKIDGILFADTPIGTDCLVADLPYRKRIQMVIYKYICIESFEFYKEVKCKK